MRRVRTFVYLGVIVILALGATASYAIQVTDETDAPDLAAAITAGSTGINVTGSSLSGNSGGGAASSGTYTNASGTYGIGPGIVLSSGDAEDYEDGPNTNDSNTTNWGTTATAAQEALLDPITGGAFTHFDVTQLDVNFDMDAGFDTVFFNVVFGSEEYPEFVGSIFIDGFGLYLNGTNIAFCGGSAVNINHAEMAAIAGTELDGVLDCPSGGSPVMLFSGPANPSGNTLTFIVADASDHSLDTTVYISALGGTPPPPPIPEPSTLLLTATGLGSLVGWARRRRSAGKK